RADLLRHDPARRARADARRPRQVPARGRWRGPVSGAGVGRPDLPGAPGGAVVIAQAAPVIPSFGGNPNSCVRRNGTFCWDWVSSHWGSTLRPALIDHIELTAIAVGIGFTIAIAAALLAYRYRRLESPLIGLWALF